MDECNVKNCARTPVHEGLCVEHVIDPAEFKAVPNRSDFRRLRLTLRRRRAGHFRRRAITRIRADHREALGYEVVA